MATTGDLIRSAMRKIGVLASGEPLTDSEGADGLQTLKQMVDYWSTQHLLIPITSKVVMQLYANIKEYTIGIDPYRRTDSGSDDDAGTELFLTDSTKSWLVNDLVGATLNNVTDGSTTTVTANTTTTITGVLTGGSNNYWANNDVYSLLRENIYNTEEPRPKQIKSAFIRDSSGTDYPQEQMTAEQYALISRKSNSSRPYRFYVRDGWPLNTIIFDSAPFDSDTMIMECLQPLSGILTTSALTDVINLPEGYENVLIYNLCLELAPEYGKEPTSLIATKAINGLKWLKRNNAKPLKLRVDNGLMPRNNSSGNYIIESGP